MRETIIGDAALFYTPNEAQVHGVKKEEKPTPLFVLTGLGSYSGYKLPFLKRHTFYDGLPQIFIWHIKYALCFKSGSCKCRVRHCNWIGFLGLTIGLCKEGKKR